MKKALKISIITTMVLMITAVLVSAQSTVLLKAESVADGIYRLVVTGTSDTEINTAEIMLSYDSAVIAPICAWDYSDIVIAQSVQQGTVEPFVSDMNIAPVQWKVDTLRTAFKLTVYSTEPVNTVDGVEIVSFYFKVIEGEKVDRDTFNFESDMSQGGFLNSVYNGNDSQSGAAIFFGTDTYAATSGAVDTITLEKTDLSGIAVDDRILVGDVNQDGSVNISDAILLTQRIASDSIILTKNQLKAADCELDSSLNIVDAVKLCQHLANKEIALD